MNSRTQLPLIRPKLKRSVDNDMNNSDGNLFKRTLIFLVVLLLLTVYFLYIIFDFSSLLRAQNWLMTQALSGNNKESGWPKTMIIPVRWPQPLILSWNTFFGSRTLMNWLLSENDISRCPYYCRYSDDKALETNASVIIFHIRDQLTPLPSNRSSNQLYVFHLLESPVHSGPNYKEVPRDFFNITMTYRQDSDVFYPYDAFDELDEEQTELQERWTEEEVLRKVDAKSELALQFVSNCHTPSRREKYVDELKMHMNVTLMGSCVNRTDCDGGCVEKLFDSHFFYLAFENSVCKDYLTEKFWNIKKLIVPVVLTRKVLAGLNLPQDAFIAADDFNGTKELAEHLQGLVENRDLYMNYMQWIRRFKKSEHRKEMLNPLCQLCKLAYEQPRERRIDDIVAFWEGGGKCHDRFAETNLLINKTTM